MKNEKKYDPDKIPLPPAFAMQIMMTPVNAHYLRSQSSTNSGIVNRLVDDLRCQYSADSGVGDRLLDGLKKKRFRLVDGLKKKKFRY